MPGCTHCGKQWPDGFSRCPDDGAALIASASGYGNAAPELAYESDEDLPPGSFAGEYQIERKIGEGGMGSVYGARHPVIGKRAAIKVISRDLSRSRESVDRFVLEAQSVNQIGHPNIVDVFGFGRLDDGRSFFVMEWLEGESLRDRLQRALHYAEALEILESIARALQAAHESGVVHRDLKPDNVYLQSRKGDKPTVKLLDFGLAKLTGRNDTDQQFDRTRTGVVMGTPLYLSPEQAKGGWIDTATDVYSLGAMAYEMFAGVVPFKADSAVEIMAMHISRRAIPLIDLAPWVPPEINDLVLQMLEKEPHLRPPTAHVYERLSACRARSSAGTIGMAIHPASGPPMYTPQFPAQTPGMHVPAPGMQGYHMMSTPLPRPTLMPGVQGGYGAVGQSAVVYSSSGRRRSVLIIAAIAVIGAAIGGVAFVVAGKQKASPEAEQVATLAGERAKAEPTPGERAKVEPTPGERAKAEPTPGEPAKTEPAETEPVKTVPVKREPPKRGRVIVSFDGPPKAQVVVDGKPHGRETSGRVTLELAPGSHRVRVQAKGYKPAETRVRVESGDSRTVELTLEKRKSVNAVHDPFAD